MKSRVAITIIIPYHLFCEFVSSVVTLILACFSYLSDYLQIKLQHKLFRSIFTFLNHDLCTINHGLRTINHGLRTINHGSRTLNHGSRTLNHGSRTLNHGSRILNHGSRIINHGSRIVNHNHNTLSNNHQTFKHLYKSFVGKNLSAKYVYFFINYKKSWEKFIQYYSKLYDSAFHCHCGYSNVLQHEKHIIDFYNKSGQPIFYTGFS